MLKGAPKEGTASSADGWLSYTKGSLCDRRPTTPVSLRPVMVHPQEKGRSGEG